MDRMAVAIQNIINYPACPVLQQGAISMSELGKLYLTPDELVQRYEGRITTRTLANWRSQGISPPYTKVGGRILYPIKCLLEWERRRTVSSTSSYSNTA